MIRQEVRFIVTDGRTFETLQEAQEAEAIIAVRKAVEETACYGQLEVNQVVEEFKHWYEIYEQVKAQG